jgi:hypothetical protein
LPELSITNGFLLPTFPEGVGIGKKAKIENRQEIDCQTCELPSFELNCPEAGCNFSCSTYELLDRHVTLGVHRQTSHDKVSMKWVQRLEAASSEKIKAAKEVPATNLSPTINSPPQGWALRGTRKFKQHSAEVKAHLTRIFEKGRLTGQKADPKEISKNLKSARNANGKKLFEPEDWLTPHQIGSYFSRLAAKHSKLHLENEEEADADATVNYQERESVKDIFFQS